MANNGHTFFVSFYIQDTVYTVPDVARMFGRKECTIRKRIEKGLIPAHKMGRCWYILKSELVAGLRDT